MRLFHKILVIMSMLYDIIVFAILSGILYTNPNSHFSSSSPNELDIKLKEAYALSMGRTPCNCTLDLIGNTMGFELPNVKLIKNESMQSQTEGTLKWTESKQLAADGVIIGEIYVANQSAGALVDLNTMRVRQNQPLSLEITGGTLPDIVRVEVINSSSATNNTGLKIGDIQIDKKISESTLLFNKAINRPTSNQNSFTIHAAQSSGEIVLVVSLLYNNSDVRGASGASGSHYNISAVPTQLRPPDIAGIYTAILSIKGSANSVR
jgi:hypothetical protein